MKEISDELKINIDNQILSTIMKLPDALKTEKPELQEEEWNLVKEKLTNSLDMLDLYRIEEGRSIELDLKKSMSRIRSSLKTIESFEEGRIAKVREKLILILKENNGTENIDKNRFEQELIFYLEKFDINEEKVRLQKHCDYFIESIETDAPNG